MRLVILCVTLGAALAACGGKIDGDDGGTPGVDSGQPKKDAQPPGVDVISPPPPPPSCSQIQTQTAVGSDGSCTSAASWSCGDTKYSVECTCPTGQCTCSQQSGSTGTGTILKEPSFCPKCDGTEMPQLCGFPTN